MNKIIIYSILGLMISFQACKKDDVYVHDQEIIMEKVFLGHAENFAVLAGTAVTNTGSTTITGDLGLSPGSSVDGFPSGEVIGTVRINDDLANMAKEDLTTAYNNAKDRTSKDVVNVSGNIGGCTLRPGLYKASSTLEISSGNLTLDARGDENAVFIFQIASSLTVTSGLKVFLTGGALAKNVFWQVSSSANFGTNSVFKGNVLALESITFESDATTLEGRALARSGAVTLIGNEIVIK